jgi:transglutaminase-like putative cysteine protease
LWPICAAPQSGPVTRTRIRSYALTPVATGCSHTTGDLRHGFRDALPIDPGEAFEPIGRTDSEHFFCWLLNRVRDLGARRIADVSPDQWGRWLQQINALGTLNVVLTDGHTLIASSDAFGYRPLHWIRRAPPAPPVQFEGPEVSLTLGSDADSGRTALVVSTSPLGREHWTQLQPGHVLAACRGEIVWTRQPIVSAAAQPSGEYDLPLANDPARNLAGLPARMQTRGAEDASLIRAARRIAAPEILTAATAREHGRESAAEHDASRVLRTVHRSVYTYTSPVLHSSHVLRLRPVHDEYQQVLDFHLVVEPDESPVPFEDVFGNSALDLLVRKTYERFSVTATSVVRLLGSENPRLRSPNARHRLPLVWMPWQRQMMTPYLLSPELPETQLRELSEFAMSFAERQDFDLIETLNDMNRTINRDFSYRRGATTLASNAFDVYVARAGVCQDFANLFIALCRLLDVPARYRVGYVYTANTFANPEQGDESHAWVEVYVPQVGWRGFDPTNNCLAGRNHVRVAAGRNFRDAAPITGTLWGSATGEKLSVSVVMNELYSSLR